MFFIAFIGTFLLLWGIFYAVLPALWRSLQFVASGLAHLMQRSGRVKKWTASPSRIRDYWPLVAIAIAGLALAAWLGESFMDLAELVHAKNGVLQKMDNHIHDWAVSHRSPGATLFFATISTVGGPLGMAIISVIAGIAMAIGRRWRWLAYFAVTTCGGALLNIELKRYFARARPDIAEMLRLATGYSFPSGHAMGSTVVLSALAYLVIRLTTRWRWKAAAFALAITMVISIAASRVYLGAHWLSDVGAGLAGGATWSLVMTVAYETFRRIHGIREARKADPGGSIPQTPLGSAASNQNPA